MSYLIDKYKGIYRLKCPYDVQTNEYPRKINGNFEDIDIYIDCQYGNKIFYYGKGILEAYIPSKGRGRNIVKSIFEKNKDLIFDIKETDEEVLFKFNSKNDNEIFPLLKPKTSGANRSPFSTKNLPKAKYEIPEEDLKMYKELTAGITIESGMGLKLNQINKDFLKTLTSKKYTMEDLKRDMSIKMLQGKEYIHSIGKWNEYIKYLKQNL